MSASYRNPYSLSIMMIQLWLHCSVSSSSRRLILEDVSIPSNIYLVLVHRIIRMSRVTMLPSLYLMSFRT